MQTATLLGTLLTFLIIITVTKHKIEYNQIEDKFDDLKQFQLKLNCLNFVGSHSYCLAYDSTLRYFEEPQCDKIFKECMFQSERIIKE